MTPVQAMLDRAARISAYKGAIAFDTQQQADEYRAYTQLSRWIETGRVERVAVGRKQTLWMQAEESGGGC